MTAYTLSALAIALIGIIGLVIQSSLPKTGKIRRGMFCFYTSQSNLLVVLYEFSLFTAGVLGAGAVYRALTHADVALSVAACIWVTHLIYHFVLRPHSHRIGSLFVDSVDKVGNVLVHYVTPLLTLLQWLLLADKSALGVRSALWWLILPLAYFVYAMLRARTGRPIGNTDLLYPYPFLDYPSLGPKKLCRNVVLLMACFFALGLLLVGVGKLTLLLR